MNKIYVILRSAQVIEFESGTVYPPESGETFVYPKGFKDKQKAIDYLAKLEKEYEKDRNYKVQGGGHGSEYLSVVDSFEYYEIYFTIEEVEVE